MKWRRLLPLLTLLALLVAPFGRMAAAQAMTAPHHTSMAIAGHCDNMASPDQKGTGKTAVDCMIACAVVAPPSALALDTIEPVAMAQISLALPVFTGLNPEADPPPPRIS